MLSINMCSSLPKIIIINQYVFLFAREKNNNQYVLRRYALFEELEAEEPERARCALRCAVLCHAVHAVLCTLCMPCCTALAWGAGAQRPGFPCAGPPGKQAGT